MQKNYLQPEFENVSSVVSQVPAETSSSVARPIPFVLLDSLVFICHKGADTLATIASAREADSQKSSGGQATNVTVNHTFGQEMRGG